MQGRAHMRQVQRVGSDVSRWQDNDAPPTPAATASSTPGRPEPCRHDTLLLATQFMGSNTPVQVHWHSSSSCNIVAHQVKSLYKCASCDLLARTSGSHAFCLHVITSDAKEHFVQPFCGQTAKQRPNSQTRRL